MNEVVESTAFNLETDQISDILETETGYYILKCLSTLDREETEANKVLIVERQRKETFEKQLKKRTIGDYYKSYYSD